MSAEQMHTPLKPCPFCGRAASVSNYETESLWSHDQVTYTKVSCDECDIALQTEPGHETQAIAAWNTRADAASSQERIAQLEAQAESLRTALKQIAFLRPLGPTRNKMVEQMERIAVDALDAASSPAFGIAAEREAIAQEARRYASHYPQSSDGRNTFILLAEWIEARAAPERIVGAAK